MRFLRTILTLILWLAAVAAAVVGALLTAPERFGLSAELRRVGQSTIESLNQFFAQARVSDWQFLFWLTVLLLCVLIAISWLFDRPRRLRIERVVDGGRVLMSPQATKHYIATALAPFSDLACKRIDLSQGRRGLEAIVHAELRTQEDVSTLERQLIERVHSALTKDLGIANVSKVNVVIKEFGLPKGVQPKPVPAVPVPGAAEAVAAQAPAAQPVESSAKTATAVDAAPGQGVTGIYTSPALSPAPSPAAGSSEKPAVVVTETKTETTVTEVPPGLKSSGAEGIGEERKSDTPLL